MMVIHLSKEVEDLKKQLKLQEEEYKEFLYIISHDLNTPVRLINSFLQLLTKNYGDQLDETAKEYIDFAVTNANKLTKMISGLLAVSRVKTRGKEFEEADLNLSFENVLEKLSSKIEEKKAIITKTNLPTLLVDENQLQKVFLSLIDNALKFQQDDKKPEISIAYSLTDGEHVFSVSDNGIGIQQDSHERIFQIFQRLHSEDEFEGIGLGLAICKRIIERHNGRIWVESNLDKGSKFIFTLPVS